MPIVDGWSGIFALPYRIQAEEPLPELEYADQGIRYRVYAPFLVRADGTPLTADVPMHLWPRFTWHPSVPAQKRGGAGPITAKYGNAILYDGLRIDLWGPDVHERLMTCFQSFMRWLRYASGQPWISDVDRHFESTQKRVFPIDIDGAAVDEATPVLQMLAITTIRLVTADMWRSAFYAAVCQKEVPVYWNLFYDGVNARAVDDYSRAVMTLAMSLEICRDQNVSRIHPAKDVAGRGPKLKAPFNHTNLIDHLSVNLRDVYGRDFSTEEPTHWPHIRDLYKTRHHVAHGSGPVYPTDTDLKLVDSNTFSAWQLAVFAALLWLEKL